MIFAEFFHDNRQPGCGDRSVLVLDGRQSVQTWKMHAAFWAKKHGWGHYRICKGEAFTRSSPIMDMIKVHDPRI